MIHFPVFVISDYQLSLEVCGGGVRPGVRCRQRIRSILAECVHAVEHNGRAPLDLLGVARVVPRVNLAAALLPPHEHPIPGQHPIYHVVNCFGRLSIDHESVNYPHVVVNSTCFLD